MSAAGGETFEGSAYLAPSGQWAWKITLGGDAFIIVAGAGYASEGEALEAMYAELAERVERVERVEWERIERCAHDSGYRTQVFDADGCGYYRWTCDACGWADVDTLS